MYFCAALMWRVLHDDLGDAAFARLRRDWIQDHLFSNEDRDRLAAWWSEESGKDLTGFFTTWLLAKKTPTVVTVVRWFAVAALLLLLPGRGPAGDRVPRRQRRGEGGRDPRRRARAGLPAGGHVVTQGAGLHRDRTRPRAPGLPSAG